MANKSIGRRFDASRSLLDVWAMLGREDLTTGAFGGQAIDVSSGVESLRDVATFSNVLRYPDVLLVSVEWQIRLLGGVSTLPGRYVRCMHICGQLY